jgi:hypothetical protein
VKNIPSDYLVPVYEGPNHIDGETTAPLWIPAVLFLEIVFKGHLEAVKKSIQKLMGEREYAYALMNIC